METYWLSGLLGGLCIAGWCYVGLRFYEIINNIFFIFDHTKLMVMLYLTLGVLGLAIGQSIKNENA